MLLPVADILFVLLRDDSISIASGYWLDDRGVGVAPVGSRIFASPYRPDRLWSSPNFLYMVIGSSFPEVKRPGREADHSPPTNTDVKKTWIYTSIPPDAFVA
jgi:hypothetical protein